jgi:C_GCAxxG_C_C family probable redox protein
MEVARLPTRRGFVKLGVGVLGGAALAGCVPIEYAMMGVEQEKIEPLSEEELEQLPEKVVAFFSVAGNCAQTSFGVLRDAYGLDDGDGQMLKALTAFPGLALRGETCGGVVGSMLAMGLAVGVDELGDQEGFQRALSPSREFCERFEAEFGSTECEDLLESQVGRPIDLLDPEDNAAWVKAGGPAECTQQVVRAVQIAAEIINEAIKTA